MLKYESETKINSKKNLSKKKLKLTWFNFINPPNIIWGPDSKKHFF